MTNRGAEMTDDELNAAVARARGWTSQTREAKGMKDLIVAVVFASAAIVMMFIDQWYTAGIMSAGAAFALGTYVEDRRYGR